MSGESVGVDLENDEYLAKKRWKTAETQREKFLKQQKSSQILPDLGHFRQDLGKISAISSEISLDLA